jgi:Fe-S cluster biogenesis protein NfuA
MGIENDVKTATAQTDAPVDERLRSLLETLSAYIEYYHGGSVEMVGYEDGLLQVHMGGACDGCDLAEATLHGWVEGTVRQFFPEVEAVEAV